MGDYWHHIVQARAHVAENNYDDAFEIFFEAFEQNPLMIRQHEMEFRDVLLKLTTKLAESKKMDIIFNNFGRALKVFPNNAHLLNDIGKYLYKYGYYKEAWEHFEKVLKIAPNSATAEKSLNSIKNLLVERWHFRMLNDNLRNESYRLAIRQAVISHEENVLDVGTGTGLLAIYAWEAGPYKIMGCDGSEVMCNLADNIVRGNKIKTIKIINKMSTDLTLWDLGGKCSVLLTEMFDAGLFGEHILQMLSHAWPALLTKQATVIPNTAEFFVVGVECEHLSKTYHLLTEAKSLLDISALNVHAYVEGETYDCEDVHLIKNIKYITDSQSVLKINFNDLRDIKKTLERTEPFKIKLKAKTSGTIDVIVGWFNLYLSDLITITTNPLAPDRANAWQQAIFFDDVPKTVQENESMTWKFLMNGGKLTKVANTNSVITRASPEVVRFLNDAEYMKMISGCVSMACIHLAQVKQISGLTIVDLSPFPFFGLMMLKRGAKSLLCCANNEIDKDFIVRVFSENKIPMSNVTIIYGDDWTSDIFGDNLYHAIFTHFLDLDGDVNTRLLQISENLKYTHLVQGGLFLPANIHLVAQLISSHWLDLNNRLYNDNVSKFVMDTYMNKYKVTQNFSIDFSVLKNVPISEPTVLCSYPEGMQYEASLVCVETEGYANAILCWYNIELIENTQEISTNRPSSFMNGTLFLTYSKEQLNAGEFVNIIQHKDTDGSFKLVMELTRRKDVGVTVRRTPRVNVPNVDAALIQLLS